jgi:hypothetical protein
MVQVQNDGIPIDGSANIYCDSASVAVNLSKAALTSKKNIIAYRFFKVEP